MLSMLFFLFVSYYIVFSFISRLLRSTLFPYTTLFRSKKKFIPNIHILMTLAAIGAVIIGEYMEAALLILIFGDRKSTRLNSSHVAISYAVFCLKKKKKDQRRHSINIQEIH